MYKNLKRIITLATLFVVVSLQCFSQNKFTISGTLKDTLSGEELIGVVLKVKELNNVAVQTNEYGFFSITLPEGEYTIQTIYVGYKPNEISISLTKSIILNLKIGQQVSQLQEVEITTQKRDENVRKNQMGELKLDMKSVEKIPVVFGERDVLKTIQLLPGVKSSGEGNAGFNVRGGGGDQNLILLDEAPVYNASHLLGFFSVFNSDAIKDATMYKGTAGVEHGGRVSSVLDIRMKDGNDKRYSVSGGIGLISSRLTIEGPIKKEKGSFIISGRRSYADLFLKLSPDKAINTSDLFFYDLNVKANYRINDKNRIFLSGYFGKDVLAIANLFGASWGNSTGTLRWNHIFNDKLFSNTSLIISNFNYKISVGGEDTKIEVISRLNDFNIKQDFEYFLSPRSKLKFGANFIYHSINPGQIEAASKSTVNNLKLTNRNGLESAVYVSHDFKISEKLAINYGVRLGMFNSLGKGNFYEFKPDGTLNNTSYYNSGDIVKTYINPEPRLNLTYILNENSSLKGSYTRNIQNLHQLSNSTSAAPTDVWIMNSNNVRPEIGDQFAVGYFKNFADNKFEFSAETYYKSLQNQIDFRSGAEPIGNELVEGQLLRGKGRAYGLELLVRKKTGRFTGWLGYTLSKTERQIDGINNNNWYAARQDRTHDLTLVMMYELSKKWTISANFVYYTGNAVTFPSGKYQVNGQTSFLFSDRNGYRMPSYHRLDLGATFMIKKTEKRESSLNFSVYNAYNQYNPFTITFRENADNPNKTEAVKTTLYGIIPSITWNFKY